MNPVENKEKNVKSNFPSHKTCQNIYEAFQNNAEYEET